MGGLSYFCRSPDLKAVWGERVTATGLLHAHTLALRPHFVRLDPFAVATFAEVVVVAVVAVAIADYAAAAVTVAAAAVAAVAALAVAAVVV